MNKMKKQNEGGFIAIFIVLLIGFVAILFISRSSSQSWLQAKSVQEFKANSDTRFNALSCLSIARLKIHLQKPTEQIIGEYSLGKVHCRVDSLSQYSGRAYVHTSGAFESGARLTVSAIVDQDSDEVLSIQEF